MNVLAIYNFKGGVGKTASAVNLAYLSAQSGVRTLVWDLDPQAATTFYFRVKPKVKGGHKSLIRQKRALSDLIKATDYDNLDLIPADFSYRNLDLALDELKKGTRRFRKVLRPLAAEYDQIILDCPPNISVVSENILEVATALLIPIIPTTLSLRTLDQILDFCTVQGHRDLPIFSFLTMVDRRKKLHRKLIETLQTERSYMLETAIPYASDVEQMGIRRAPVATYAANRSAAKAYQALWQEIQTRLLR